jgi:hypothetical protein
MLVDPIVDDGLGPEVVEMLVEWRLGELRKLRRRPKYRA